MPRMGGQKFTINTAIIGDAAADEDEDEDEDDNAQFPSDIPFSPLHPLLMWAITPDKGHPLVT